MLEYLSLTDVGPAPTMRVDFAPRLNVLTGDNGLGKTFALDIAWWALTRTWANLPAWPSRDKHAKPSIGYRVAGKQGSAAPVESRYDFKKQSWRLPRRRPPMPGLVLYVRVDGRFSVWDPARNYWRSADTRCVDDPERPAAYRFAPQEVWDGLAENGTVSCNGLIRDWVSWQDKRSSPAFGLLSSVLKGLSLDSDVPLEAGTPTRIKIGDARDVPTLKLPYGETPVTHASAGVRRALALAYLLVWTWQEHKEASRLLQQDPEDRFVLLYDEVETHLHPQWQRVLLPAIMHVVEKLRPGIALQVIASTHSPLVLASLETVFEADNDKIFNFELAGNAVECRREVPWAKQGDVVGWLVSDAFGLQQARSREAERAIEAAEALMRGERDALPQGMKTQEAIHAELVRVLAGHDPFWPRWIVRVQSDEGAAG